MNRDFVKLDDDDLIKIMREIIESEEDMVLMCPFEDRGVRDYCSPNIHKCIKIFGEFKEDLCPCNIWSFEEIMERAKEIVVQNIKGG